MGDLDDGPGQNPLDEREVEGAILQLLPPEHFDLIISHNPSGEYTRHVRHEEASKAVIRLWCEGKVNASELWTFAYGDANKAHLPKADEKASIYLRLTKQTWLQKYRIITEIYGFHKNSFEAETTPRTEAFWQFTEPADAERWLNNGGHYQ